MMYEEFLKVIDERKDDFCAIPDFLWDNPETSFGEYKSAEYITRFLEENGFTVTRNLCNIPTLQATANEAMHDIPVPVSTKEEFKEKTGSGYVCGTPDDVYPQIQPKPYNM